MHWIAQHYTRYVSSLLRLGNAGAYSRTADGDKLSLSECEFCFLVHIGGLDGRVVIIQGDRLLQVWRGGRRGGEGKGEG